MTASALASGRLIIDDEELGVFKVHRSTMTSAEILSEERSSVFDRCWLYLGHDSEISAPGDYEVRDVGGRPLLFCRDETSAVRAFLNVCPHRGARVCRRSSGSAKRFTCFYHGWTFANSGALVALPDEDSYTQGFERDGMGLVEVPRLECYRGFWFVCFDPGAEDLHGYLAAAREYLDLVVDQSGDGMEILGGTQQYSMNANWKLLVENSIDGYHAMTTHATYLTYLKDLGTDLSIGIHGRGRDLGNGHSVIDYRAPWGRPIALWEPGWGETAKDELQEIRAELVSRVGPERAERIAETNRNLFIFPNLIINDIMAITVRTFYPLTPNQMTVTAWALGPVGEEVALRERRLDSFLTFLGPGGFATPDDIEALEVCQQGFAAWREAPWSDISRGMGREQPQATDELQMRAFWRRWNGMIAEGASKADQASGAVEASFDRPPVAVGAALRSKL